jgi:anti-sigma factor RsiW
MNCTQVRPRLDDLVDVQLDPGLAAAIEEHIGNCAGCQAEVAFLRRLRGEAAALPRSLAPARDLWPGVVAGITRPSYRARRAIPTPVLIAAAVALMLASSLATAYWLGRRDAERPGRFIALQAEYLRAATELATRVEADEPKLAPATRAIVERNLKVIDAAIRETEAALANDPGNQSLERMLWARYQQRLELLQRAAQATPES